MGRLHRWSIFGEDVTDEPDLWEDTDILAEADVLTPEERFERITAHRVNGAGQLISPDYGARRAPQKRMIKERRQRRERRVAQLRHLAVRHE